MLLPTSLSLDIKPSQNAIGVAILNKVNTGSYWKMGEASGTRVDSVVAQGNDLTDNNTVGNAAGKIQPLAASYILANSEFLSHVATTSLNAGSTTMSWTNFGWFWLDSKAALEVLWNKFNTSTADSEYSLFYNNANDRFTYRMFGTGGSKDVVANNFGSPSTGTWYFIVSSVGGDPINTINISINAGTPDVFNKNFNHYPNQFLGSMKIGGSTGGFMSGRSGDCGFFRGVGQAGLFTQAEISYLYNNGNGRTYPFL